MTASPPPRHPLHFANFRAYLVGRLCAVLAQYSMMIVLAWQAYNIARETMTTAGASAQLGLIGLAQFLPLFFLTPIFYTYDSLPSAASSHQVLIDILHWGNPISPYVITIQDTLFFGRWPTLADTLYCVIAAVVFLLIGFVSVRRMEREMAVEL